MNRCFPTSLLGLLLTAGFLFATGCSSKPAAPWGTASGKIRIHGRPLSAGTVIFANESLGIERMAPIQADGSYQERSAGYAGLPIGTYLVAITAQQISKGDFVPAARPAKSTPPTPIPERYRKPSTSGLTAEIKEGANPPFNFDLEP